MGIKRFMDVKVLALSAWCTVTAVCGGVEMAAVMVVYFNRVAVVRDLFLPSIDLLFCNHYSLL